MTDTTQKVKDIQLAIWMSKTPEERLITFLKDNEMMYLIWKQHQESAKENHVKTIIQPEL
jgi:hypothetical protein